MTAADPSRPTSLRVLCFGEALWDCLPQGRYVGGAPLNVAYHLQQLGCEALVISAVGKDALGIELIAYAESQRLSTAFIARHHTRPTGTVRVKLAAGQPSYEITPEVAWDEIPISRETLDLAREASALVFGSLATRSESNAHAIERLLDAPGLIRFMDVNLRPPFDQTARTLRFAARADWLKLNESELAQLTSTPLGTLPDEPGLRRAGEQLGETTKCKNICVTRGARGALMWSDGKWLSAPAPRVSVQDTVGAGDAFTAALVHGVLTEKPLAKTLADACALGALVASLPGGQPAYKLPPP